MTEIPHDEETREAIILKNEPALSDPEKVDLGTSDQYDYYSPYTLKNTEPAVDKNRLIDLNDTACLQSFLESVQATVLEKVAAMNACAEDNSQLLMEELAQKHDNHVEELEARISCLEEALKTTSTQLEHQTLYKINLSKQLVAQKSEITSRWAKKAVFNRWKLLQRTHSAGVQNMCRQRRRNTVRTIWLQWRNLTNRATVSKTEALWETRLEQVSRRLMNDHEKQLRLIREELVESRDHIKKLSEEKKQRLNLMKSALMRGVNALNHETLSLFQAEP